MLFAINPVIQLGLIDRPREHVKAVPQNESRPGRGFHRRTLQQLTSQLFAELLGESQPVRSGKRSDRFEDVAHAVHPPILARLQSRITPNYGCGCNPVRGSLPTPARTLRSSALLKADPPVWRSSPSTAGRGARPQVLKTRKCTRRDCLLC